MKQLRSGSLKFSYRKSVILGLFSIVFICLGTVFYPTNAISQVLSAPDVELMPYQSSGYRFKVFEPNSTPPIGYELPNFDDSSWDLGTAAFGFSVGYCPFTFTNVRTPWPLNSQLLVRRSIMFPADASNVRVKVMIDNDIGGIFFNGVLIASSGSNFPDCPLYDHHSFTVPQNLVLPGQNSIAYRLVDRGFESFFDSRILIDTSQVPSLVSINPASPVANNVDQVVTVNGHNFQQGLNATVTLPNGQTAILSGTQIQEVTPTSFKARITLGDPGSWRLRVNNPDGGQSNNFPFSVQANIQTPVVFSIAPSAPVSSPSDQDVFVSGANFKSNLAVDVVFPGGGGTTLGGEQIQNVTDSSFIMRATFNAPGEWSIKVKNPDNQQSALFSFTVSSVGSLPFITSISPNPPSANGADQNLTVTGGNFQNGLFVNATFPSAGVSTLQGTGQIQNVTPTSFTLRITLNADGIWKIRVVNPDNSQSPQFPFSVNPSGPPPTGLPTSVLSPVIGPIRTIPPGQHANDDVWEFSQHKTGKHTPTGGISLSNDTFAWDANLYTQTSGNADAGKAVFATAPGQVVPYVGTQPGAGPGAVLIAHPNAANPVWFSGYLHMTNVPTNLVNQMVDTSTVIGEVGHVGANNDHLHFVVYSGTNMRGDLQSFNVHITERLNGVGQVDSVSPPTVAFNSTRTITINGTGFPVNPLIQATRPDGTRFTMLPNSSLRPHDENRINRISSTSITANVRFGMEGRYQFEIIDSTANSGRNNEPNQVPQLAENDVVQANSSPRTPIILIPGMLGSVLKKNISFAPDPELFPYLPDGVGPYANDRHLDLRFNVGDTRPPNERPVYASDVFRDYTLANLDDAADPDYYKQLIERLRHHHGYIEYKVDEHPERLTAAGCDISQIDASAGRYPNLFLFSYDWRNTNAQSAQELLDLVRCVQTITPGGNSPGFKFQILAHSNGGLVARRYILDAYYGSEGPHVERMLTLGTPWLGTPKGIRAIGSGEYESVNSLIKRENLKQIAPFFPGGHELLPSRLYFDLYRPFSKLGIGTYDFDQYKNRMDQLRPSTGPPPTDPDGPGTNTDQFHNKLFAGRNLQDNWSNDPTASNIAYYNFRGLLKNNITIASVEERNGVWVPTSFGPGDGTVTSLSATRGGALYGLGTVRDQDLGDFNHQQLTHNPRTFAKIECVFENPDPNTCIDNPLPGSLPSWASGVQDAHYSIRLSGSTQVLITDSYGNTTQPFSNSPEEGISTITNFVSGESYLTSLIPLDQLYKVDFRTSTNPIEVSVTKNIGVGVVRAVRYLDSNLPANVSVRIEVGPDGISALAFDSDGNGTFDTVVNPTIDITGTNAQDIDAPTLYVNETVLGGTSRVDLSAIDTGTGVQRVLYSLDGTSFQPYTTPLMLDAVDTPLIYAFADDNVFNRSGLVTHNLTSTNAGFGVTGPITAPAGSQITANWNAPSGRPVYDWIGVFGVGTMNSSFISRQYTDGLPIGTLNFVAPNQVGDYEFRYLINDAFTSVAASIPFTVTGPTAASVSVGGVVLTDGGSGIPYARITMTNIQGESNTALTNPFGYFRFDDVFAGATYTFTVSSKQYAFAQPTIVRTISDNVADLNFVAMP